MWRIGRTGIYLIPTLPIRCFQDAKIIAHVLLSHTQLSLLHGIGYTVYIYTFSKSKLISMIKVIIIKRITEHFRFVFLRTTCISITLHTSRHHVPSCILYTTRSTSSIILCPTAHYTFFLIRYVFYFPECNRINSPRHHNYVC